MQAHVPESAEGTNQLYDKLSAHYATRRAFSNEI
jgi:hypothetical protein